MRASRDFFAGIDDEGRRLDRVLRRLLPHAGLSSIHHALRTGAIRLDSKRASPASRLAVHSRISIESHWLETAFPDMPSWKKNEGSEETTESRPSSSELVLLETEHLLFLNKPKGMLVHGEGSLDELMHESLAVRREESLSFSPGPLHRLDRNTSGIVTFSRTTAGARVFSEMLRRSAISKSYLAVLSGCIEKEEYWIDSILRDSRSRTSSVDTTIPSSSESRLAKTKISPLLVIQDFTFALLRIETGRTHQIRTQAAAHGHPLVGDAKYGGMATREGYILHAWCLAFEEIPFRDVPKQVVASLPREAMTAIMRLFGVDALEVIHELDGCAGKNNPENASCCEETHTNYQGGGNG